MKRLEARADCDTDPRLGFFAHQGSEYMVLSLPVEAPRAEFGLTPAEQGVLREILAGRSNLEIASSRGSSARTVANQVAQIFRKYGVSSRAQLATCASPEALKGWAARCR